MNPYGRRIRQIRDFAGDAYAGMKKISSVHAPMPPTLKGSLPLMVC